MADTGKMRIVAEFDSAKAEESAKRTNKAVSDIGTSAKASGEMAAAGLDKMTEAAIRSQHVMDILGPDLVGVATGSKEAAAGVDVLAAATDRATQRNQEFIKSAQEAERAKLALKQAPGATGKNGPEEFDKRKEAADLEDRVRAHAKIDGLIAKSQASELSGGAKVEAQRRQAIASLGLTEDHVKRLNAHFDTLKDKAGTQELASNIKSFIQNPMAAAGNAAEAAVVKIGMVGVVVGAVALGVGILAVAFKGQADELAAYALQIQNLSDRTGLSVEQTQLFTKASEYAGVNAGVLSMAVKKLNEDLAEGGTENSKITATLMYLGIQVKRTSDGMADAGATIDQAFRALQNIPDYYKRAALAQELFGRGAKELMPYIENYDKLNARAKEHAQILAGTEVKAINEYRQSTIDLSNEWDNLVLNLVKKPAVATFSVIFHGLDSARKFLEDHADPGNNGGFRKPLIDALAAGAAKQGDDAVASANAQRRTDLTASLNARSPEDALAQLKKDVTAQADLRKHLLGDAVDPNATPAALAASRQKLKDSDAQTESLKKRIEATEQLIGADKREGAALRAARFGADDAEAKDFTGQRALELQNARQRRAAETTVGSEGTEFYRPTAAVGAEFARKLAAERISEQKKTDAELRSLRLKDYDERASQSLDALKREQGMEDAALRVRQAGGLENYRIIEDAKLALFKGTLDKETQLRVDQLRIHLTADTAEATRKTTDSLSADPVEAARQRQALGRETARLEADEAAKERQVRSDASASAADQDLTLQATRAARSREFTDETQKYEFQSAQETFTYQVEQLGQLKDRQLAQVEEVKAQSLRQKLSLEQQKLGIEVSYLQASLKVQSDAREARRKEDTSDLADKVRTGGVTPEDAAVRQQAIDARYANEQVRAAKENTDAITKAQETAARASTSLIIGEQKSIFNGIKSEVDQVFDAMVSKSQSVWGTIAGIIKGSILGAIKNVVDSQIAGALTSIVTGQNVQVEQQGGRAVPIFNGGGSGGAGWLGKFGGVFARQGGNTRSAAGPGAGSPAGGLATPSVAEVAIQSQPSQSARYAVEQLTRYGVSQSGGTPTSYSSGGASSDSSPNYKPAQDFSTVPFYMRAGALASDTELPDGYEGEAGPIKPWGVRGSNSDTMPTNPTDTSPVNPIDGSGVAPPAGAPSKLRALASKALGMVLGGGGQGGPGGPGGGAGGPGGNPLDGILGMFGFGKGPKGTYGTGTPGVNGQPGVDSGTGFGAGLHALGKSDAAGIGGSLLLTDGLTRGGTAGTIEDTAGGALVGYKYGGPIGAAVGAAAGLVAGVLRQTVLLTLPEQVRKRVKDEFHIDINKETAAQIAQIAKTQYAGSIAAAIHSPSVLQMLGLYAESTGQKFGITGPKAANLVYSGGNLEQAGTYNNGSLLGFQSGLRALNPFAGTINAPTYDKFGQEPSNITVSLDGPSSASFLQGQTVAAISGNPQVVSDASLSAASSGFNRLQQLATMQSPSTVIA